MLQFCPVQGTVSVWPDRMMPLGLPSPRVANRLALVLSALYVRRLATPSLARVSRTKWISSRLEFWLTVFMRTRVCASSRAWGESMGSRFEQVMTAGGDDRNTRLATGGLPQG
ncbi:hypothetical protein EAG14_19550 [Acidovorax sp. 1608163]|nr:hypothetical protein EAG14_19550 [Acidovorax sp. 1608163]